MPNSDIFISYRRDQRDHVALISEKLTELGLSVWFDARLEAGTSFDEEINREVRSAKAVLVCWSPEAVQSRWVRAEASIGLERDVLVAVFLRPTELITPYNLVHTVSLEGWSGAQDAASWRDLLGRIGGLVGRPNLADEAMAKALDGEWADRDRDVRTDFRGKIDEARRRFAALRENQPAAFEQGLRDMTTAFESWILRRRVNSVGDAPNPLELVDDQTEALRLDLATARRERDAVAAVAGRARGVRPAAGVASAAGATAGGDNARREGGVPWRGGLILLFGPFALNATQRRGVLHMYLGAWALVFLGLFASVMLSSSTPETYATDESVAATSSDPWGGCYSFVRQTWFLQPTDVHYHAPDASQAPQPADSPAAEPPPAPVSFATREELIAFVRAQRVAEAQRYGSEYAEPSPEPLPASPQEARAREIQSLCEFALGEETGRQNGYQESFRQGYFAGLRDAPNTASAFAASAGVLLIALNVVSLLIVVLIGAFQRWRARPKPTAAPAR